MIRRPPRSTLFPYTNALPICLRFIGPAPEHLALLGDKARARDLARRCGVPHRVRGPCRSEEHTSELQSPDHLVCRLLLEKKKTENTVIAFGQQPLPEQC